MIQTYALADALDLHRKKPGQLRRMLKQVTTPKWELERELLEAKLKAANKKDRSANKHFEAVLIRRAVERRFVRPGMTWEIVRYNSRNFEWWTDGFREEFERKIGMTFEDFKKGDFHQEGNALRRTGRIQIAMAKWLERELARDPWVLRARERLDRYRTATNDAQTALGQHKRRREAIQFYLDQESAVRQFEKVDAIRRSKEFRRAVKVLNDLANGMVDLK